MRILTVRQPWAWAIIHGGKDVENRVRNVAGSYRGPVAIHAARATFDDDGQYREIRRAMMSESNGWPASDADLWSAHVVEHDDPRFVYGAILGVVDLIDVHQPRWDDTCVGDSVCSPWAEVDGWPQHLVLNDPQALAEPIPYRGMLGLRTLPADVVAEIEEALRG